MVLTERASAGSGHWSLYRQHGSVLRDSGKRKLPGFGRLARTGSATDLRPCVDAGTEKRHQDDDGELIHGVSRVPKTA